jgi:transcriptional regulator with XRE-family HTH domain
VNVELTEAGVQELLRLITATGLSRQELARQADVSSRTVYYLLRGQASVRVVTLHALLRVITLEPAAFLRKYCGIERLDEGGLPDSTQSGQCADRMKVRETHTPYGTHNDEQTQMTVSMAVAFLARQFSMPASEVMNAITTAANAWSALRPDENLPPLPRSRKEMPT